MADGRWQTAIGRWEMIDDQFTNLSAVLRVLCVSALIVRLRLSGQNGIGGGGLDLMRLFKQVLHAGIEHVGEGFGMEANPEDEKQQGC